MIRSRRGFLRAWGVGAAAGAVLSWPLGDISSAYARKPGRAKRPDRLILLNSNENAYGPSPKVADAIRSATGKVNRYPFRKYDEITEQIATFHQARPEQVLFGCGSTEILRVAACAFLAVANK